VKSNYERKYNLTTVSVEPILGVCLGISLLEDEEVKALCIEIFILRIMFVWDKDEEE